MNIKTMMMPDALIYRVFRVLAGGAVAHQRELANRLGVSLGKVNYCVNALIDKGFIKVENFRRSPNKRGDLYRLTPSGLAEKARVTLRFLRCKTAEFEVLQQELAQLRQEASDLGLPDGMDETETMPMATVEERNG